MITRFQGDDGHHRLIDALRRQTILHDDEELATRIADTVSLRQLEPQDVLINQNSADNDLYFVLSGRLSVVVNGREVAVRSSGQHVGEMALIDSSARRSATVLAIEQTVVAAISEPAFSSFANTDPRLWRLLAMELGDRLRQRNVLVPIVNPRPVLFIGSSVESLRVARAIQAGLRHDNLLVRLWSDGGVFGASNFAIEDLETQIKTADFAVLVLGPDDKVISRNKEQDAPRDNVIFELGLFMGALSRRRSFIVQPRGTDIKIPSDLLGLTPLTYQTGPADELPSLIAPVCNDLRGIIEDKGPK